MYYKSYFTVYLLIVWTVFKPSLTSVGFCVCIYIFTVLFILYFNCSGD